MDPRELERLKQQFGLSAPSSVNTKLKPGDVAPRAKTGGYDQAAVPKNLIIGSDGLLRKPSLVERLVRSFGGSKVGQFIGDTIVEPRLKEESIRLGQGTKAAPEVGADTPEQVKKKNVAGLTNTSVDLLFLAPVLAPFVGAKLAPQFKNVLPAYKFIEKGQIAKYIAASGAELAGVEAAAELAKGEGINPGEVIGAGVAGSAFAGAGVAGAALARKGKEALDPLVRRAFERIAGTGKKITENNRVELYVRPDAEEKSGVLVPDLTPPAGSKATSMAETAAKPPSITDETLPEPVNIIPGEIAQAGRTPQQLAQGGSSLWERMKLRKNLRKGEDIDLGDASLNELYSEAIGDKPGANDVYEAYIKNWVDDLAVLRRTEGQNGKVTYKDTLAYRMAQTLDNVTRGLAKQDIQEYRGIIKNLKGPKDAQVYGVVRTLLDLADDITINDVFERGIKLPSGASRESVQLALDNIRKAVGQETWERIFSVVQKQRAMNFKLIDEAVKSGRLTQEVADFYKQYRPNHLKLDPVIDEDNIGSKLLAHEIGLKKGLTSLDMKLFARRYGKGGRRIGDVFKREVESVLRMRADIVKQPFIDRVAKEFGVEIGTVQRASTSRKIPWTKNIDTSKIPEGYSEWSGAVSKDKVYALPNAIIEGLQSMTKSQADIVTRMISAPNNVFKAAATSWRLAFSLLFNPQKDVLTAWLRTNGSRRRFIYNALVKTPIAFTKDWLYRLTGNEKLKSAGGELFRKSGTSFSGFYGSVEDARGFAVPAHLKPLNQRAWEGVKSIVTVPMRVLDTLSYFAESFEKYPRAAEMFSQLQGGKVKVPEVNLLDAWINQDEKLIDSLFRAQNITVNFNKAGTYGRLGNKAIPFLNPMIQGWMNVYSEIKERPVQAGFRLMTQLAIPYTMIYLYNKGYENDTEVPDYIKKNYYYINTGMTSTREDGTEEPVVFTWRKPEYDILTWPITKALDGAYGNDPKLAEKSFLAATAEEYLYGAINRVVPPLLSAILENQANYDFFYQKPIVPESREDLDPELQYSRGTPNVYRFFGEQTNMAPAKIQNFIEGFLPALRQGSTLVDPFFANNVIEPRQKERSGFDILESIFPIVRSVSDDEEEADKIYKFSDEVTQKTRSIRERVKIQIRDAMRVGDLNTANQLLEFFPKGDRKEIAESLQQEFETYTPTEKAFENLDNRGKTFYLLYTGNLDYFNEWYGSLNTQAKNNVKRYTEEYKQIYGENYGQ